MYRYIVMGSLYLGKLQKIYYALGVACLLVLGSSTARAVDVYRSVGTTTTAIADGTGGRTLTIAAGTATFSTAMPTNIGVGDVIQYDSDGNSTIDSVAFIHGRTSSTVFSVKAANGSSNPTAVTADADWGLYRAYTSLNNAYVGDENDSLDNGIENFDAHASNRNLVTATEVYHLAMYGGSAADSTIVNWSGWTTNATYYLDIFSPTLSTEVGVSQRHSGIWDTSKYYHEVGSGVGDNSNLRMQTNSYRITGIQIRKTAVANGQSSLNGVWAQCPTNSCDIRISNNIFRGVSNTATGSNYHVGISMYQPGGTSGTYRIWNNVFYDYTGDNTHGAMTIANYSGNPNTYYIYNNTSYNCHHGFVFNGTDTATSGGDTVYLKNNIVQAASAVDGVAYYQNSGPHASSNYNISNLAAAPPGANSVANASVTFNDAAGGDFRPAANDVVAKDTGTNLSADAGLAFSVDAKNKTRSTWDIGAFEAYAPATTVSNLVVSGVTYNGFTATIDYVDDDDSDAACTLYYCNNTDSAACDPATGSSAGMSRSGSTFTLDVSSLSNPNNPNDVLNVRTVCTDGDGMTGGTQNSTATLANETLAPKAPTGVSAL